LSQRAAWRVRAVDLGDRRVTHEAIQPAMPSVHNQCGNAREAVSRGRGPRHVRWEQQPMSSFGRRARTSPRQATSMSQTHWRRAAPPVG
jgi:hypothetical protein